MSNELREKQIEEMAKDIPYLTLDRTVFVGATKTKNVSWMLSEEDNKVIAEELVKKGWIKLNKDSVVLSREEYELYDVVKKGYPNDMTCLAEKFTEISHNSYTRGSKETAEKYKGFIRELLTNGDDSITTYYSDVKYRLIREDDLQELAKQFRVEIKEN